MPESSQNEDVASDAKASEAVLAPLHEFYRSHGYDLKCPVCGFDRSWVLDRLPKHSTAIPLTGGIVRPFPEGIETLAMGCMQCGYVRQHLRAIVEGKVQIPEADDDAS